MVSDDVKVLEAAVTILTRALNELAGACMAEDGGPKAPDRGALMRARAILPARYEHALTKEQR